MNKLKLYLSKDPDGFIFFSKGTIYRQVNITYKQNYDQLINSGLYQELISQKLLIPHQEIKNRGFRLTNTYKILKPVSIPFISYPYEWSFSALKDAAILTLKVQKIALQYEMTLKDASAYNVQFYEGRPIFIDTLSFEKYTEGKPWNPYKQFCQHFLAPLALMAYKDLRLNQLMRIYLDGIPLDLACKLLPITTYTSLPILIHLHFHAKTYKNFQLKSRKIMLLQKFSKGALEELLNNLKSTVGKLSLKTYKSQWSNYYQMDSYSPLAFKHKKESVTKFMNVVKPKTVWDLGANIGIFSSIAARQGIDTVAFDFDPVIVEENYLKLLLNQEHHLLPLYLDITNPSPSQGFGSQELKSLEERGPADLVLALALIHHFAIANNISLTSIASFIARICRTLIVEFVPKNDPQVIKMLKFRKDIFSSYDQINFEKEFGKLFEIKKLVKIKDSLRLLYLMRKK